MKHLNGLTFIFLLVLTTGCSTALINSGALPGTGTTLIVDQSFYSEGSTYFSYDIVNGSKVSEKGMSIFKNRIESQLKQKRLYKENSNIVIEITFDNYYMRPGAARALIGVMAGVDNITTTVVIKDNNKIVGEFRVISKNATAWGSANSLIEQHADKIIAYLVS
jgi:hypothetical protein